LLDPTTQLIEPPGPPNSDCVMVRHLNVNSRMYGYGD
jgi:hypothetical protein